MEGTSIPVRRSRARTQATANRIRQQILSGAWVHGRLLPSERDMAAQFGIARNTLRRIIRQLEAEGLIDSQPGRGSVVRLSPLGGQMSHADLAPVTAAADQPALLEMRTLLEPLVAELAAGRATAEDIAAMETALRNALDAKEAPAFEAWDAALHQAIWRATHNSALLAWYEAVQLDLQRRTVPPAARADYLRDHAAIVAAMRTRDPVLAGELMRKSATRKREPQPSRLPADALA